MASSITFGVETEFNLAFLYDDEFVADQAETRVIDASLAEEVIRHKRSFYGFIPNEPIPENIREEFRFNVKKRSMLYNIRDKLRSIGSPAEIHSAVDPPSVWEICYDESLEAPEETPYCWLPMEIKSPALPFTPASLELVKEVCALIDSTYITNTNRPTGVHVHISAGKTPLDFHTMQKLYVFLWVFEPQMSTLHPTHRQKKWGDPPSILQGIAEFYKCQNLESLLNKAMCCARSKFTAFNSRIALCWVKEPHCSHKPTVECRQHEGTLDGERIIQWIKFLAGLVQSLETISSESFTELLEHAQNEKWEKTDKDKAAHDENQAEFGPIPAESTLTIIDILEYLGLKSREILENLNVFIWNTDAHVAATPTKPAGNHEAGEQGTKEFDPLWYMI
ncbi:putative amidoligase enzyme-domain-containing protein [Cadophora sp. MPI-SDFR-AT-0126]|nr:putative amidoligase enzyme-domain-containing protein [Leotiomycetes sp. MPI-SDFR-AT-0126]